MRGDPVGLYDWRDGRAIEGGGGGQYSKAEEEERDPTTTGLEKGDSWKEKGKNLYGGAMQQGLAVVV